MRVVSTKLKMVDAFTEVEFFGTINKWLKNAGPCKAVAEQLEACEEKVGVHLEAEYCIADTFRIEKEKATFTLFKLEQLFHQQTWTTEIILISSGGANEVFFHIDCSRDATRFDEAPEMRTEVASACPSMISSGCRMNIKPIMARSRVTPTTASSPNISDRFSVFSASICQ